MNFVLKAMCQCTGKPVPNPGELQNRSRSYFPKPIVWIISSFLRYISAEEAGKRLFWRRFHPLKALTARIRFIDLIIHKELNHHPLQLEHFESKFCTDPWGLCWQLENVVAISLEIVEGGESL